MSEKSSNLKSPVPRPTSIIEFSLLIVLAIAMFWQCRAIRAVSSTTFDETIYATFCSQTIKTGAMNQYAEYGTAPLPVLWNYALPTAIAPAISPPTNLWTEVAAPPWIIQWARTIQASTVAILLLVIPYLWIRRRWGGAAGLTVAALVGFSPSIVAHASLATTDAPFVVTVLLALTTMTRYLRNPSTGCKRFASVPWIGFAVGISLSTKYSGIVLLPIAALIVFVKRHGDERRTLRERISSIALLLTIAFAVWWAAHAFAWIRLPVGSWTIVLPAPLGGFLKQVRLANESRPVFLCGQISERGWWYYFPLAWWYKSTPAEILLGVVAVVGTAVRVWRNRRTLIEWMNDCPEQWLPLLTSLMYLAMAMQSTMNTGHRYLLPLYPLMALTGINVLSDAIIGRRVVRNSSFVWQGLLLVAVQFQAAVGISPHDLAYFNHLAGGPENGHKLLVDSSLDWGQDLPSLAELLADRPNREMILAYFGTAQPRDYGLTSINWLNAEKTDLSRVQYIAISATFLHGVYLDDDFFAEFRELPAERAGYSIFVYSVENSAVRSAGERMLQAVDKAKSAKSASPNPGGHP